MKSMMREFAKNSVIFWEEEVGNAAYILSEGSVEISRKENGKKTIIAVLKPVAVFGEMALLLKDQKRTATATALTPSKLAEISRKDFDDFVDQSPKLITAVLRAMVSRLQKTTTRVTHSPDMFTAVIRTLHLFIGHNQFHGIRYDLFVSCLAEGLKAQNQEIERILTFMETVGLIDLKIDGDQTTIDIIRPVDFLERSRKIYHTFAQMGMTTNTDLPV